MLPKKQWIKQFTENQNAFSDWRLRNDFIKRNSVCIVRRMFVGTEHALCIKRFNIQPDEEFDSKTNSCGTVLSC